MRERKAPFLLPAVAVETGEVRKMDFPTRDHIQAEAAGLLAALQVLRSANGWPV